MEEMRVGGMLGLREVACSTSVENVSVRVWCDEHTQIMRRDFIPGGCHFSSQWVSQRMGLAPETYGTTLGCVVKTKSTPTWSYALKHYPQVVNWPEYSQEAPKILYSEMENWERTWRTWHSGVCKFINNFSELGVRTKNANQNLLTISGSTEKPLPFSDKRPSFGCLTASCNTGRSLFRSQESIPVILVLSDLAPFHDVWIRDQSEVNKDWVRSVTLVSIVSHLWQFALSGT